MRRMKKYPLAYYEKIREIIDHGGGEILCENDKEAARLRRQFYNFRRDLHNYPDIDPELEQDIDVLVVSMVCVISTGEWKVKFRTEDDLETALTSRLQLTGGTQDAQ